jgi:hypothetical protein
MCPPAGTTSSQLPGASTSKNAWQLRCCGLQGPVTPAPAQQLQQQQKALNADVHSSAFSNSTFEVASLCHHNAGWTHAFVLQRWLRCTPNVAAVHPQQHM